MSRLRLTYWVPHKLAGCGDDGKCEEERNCGRVVKSENTRVDGDAVGFDQSPESTKYVQHCVVVVYFTNIFAPRFDSSFSYKLILKSKYGERTIIEAKYFQLFIVPLFPRVDMECPSKHFSFLHFSSLRHCFGTELMVYGYPLIGCRL